MQSEGCLQLATYPYFSHVYVAALISQRVIEVLLLFSRAQAPQILVGIVPQYFFCVSHGKYANAHVDGFEAADKKAAWAEMTRVCGDLVGGISRDMQQNSAWQIELLDEYRAPIFRIRFIAETIS